MIVSINGAEREVPEKATVARVLEALGLVSARVAVERNTRLVPRAEHTKVELEAGDMLEIVHFVGGG
ncbi:MAG: sulfur carrier protein ThiS [Deltaproteobacteria bacterium]|nr:sulfur carrier protein ThiS [Deltaproteobacteria bacterium]